MTEKIPSFTFTLNDEYNGVLWILDIDEDKVPVPGPEIMRLQSSSERYQLEIVEHEKYSVRELAQKFKENLSYNIRRDPNHGYQRLAIKSPKDNELITYNNITDTVEVFEDLINIQENSISRRVLEFLRDL
jgi:hypothetical protein